jgi:outer membrane protein assembly factor BamA
LHIWAGVKSLLVLTAAVAATAWVAVRHLPGEAQAEPMLSHTQEVQSVSLDGGRGLPLAALRDVLSTHRGDQLDASQLVLDRAALEGELESRGYLAARVEPALVTFAPSGGAYITFRITPGPVYKLRSITVKGASPKDTSVVTLIAGDDAVASRIERARQVLADTLGRRGKPASVTIALHPDAAQAAVDVELVSK